jgi:hypothetical protein
VFRHITVVLLATLVLTVFLSMHHSFAKNAKCEDGYAHMNWDPKNHDSNKPSSKEFKMLAYKGSLCELSKCVDMEECTNQDAVNWQKFKNSPAYELSEDDEKKCLTQANKDGNGQDGLVGYEVLACGIGDY